MTILFRRFALAALLAFAAPALAQSVPVKGSDGNIYSLRTPNPDGRAAAANSAPVVLSNEDQATFGTLFKGCTATAAPPTLTTGTTYGTLSCDLAGNFRAYLANTAFGAKLQDASGNPFGTPGNPVATTTVVTAVPAVPDTTGTGSIVMTATGNVASFAPAGQGTIVVAVSGTWTGTLTPQIVAAGQTANVSVIPIGVGLAYQTSITGNGIYELAGGGKALVQLASTVVGTGTATVTWLGTNAPALIGVRQSNPLNLAVSAPAIATGGATPYHLVSTASTNATLVATGPHTLYGMTLTGLNTTAAYVHVIDAAAASCSLAPAHTYLVLGSATAQGGVNVPVPTAGEAYLNGLTFCITGAAADGDTSTGPAGVIVNLSYK